MPQDREKHENVVSLAEARRRQRTLQRSGANGRPPQDKAPKPQRGWPRLFAYAQFLLFLGVLAYMMQLCKGGY